MIYEKVFQLAGSMGRGQYLIIFAVYFTMGCSGWQQLMTVFAARDVNFYCATTNSSYWNPNSGLPVYDNVCVEGCLKYIYEPGISSIVRDFNLDCGPKKYLKHFIHSPFWFGYLVSNLISGYLGDKTGRKPTCVISLLVYILATMSTILSPNIESLLITRLFTGFANGGCFSLSYLIMVECCGKRYLSRLALFSQIMYGIGGVFVAGVANVFIFSWRLQVSLFLAMISFAFCLCTAFLPESPRWLYTQDRKPEAEQVLRWIARLNGKEDVEAISFRRFPVLICDKSLECVKYVEISVTGSRDLSSGSSHSNDRAWICDLCSTFRGAALLISHLFFFPACAFIYFGLNFNVEDIGGNMYLSSVLLTACEFPTLVLSKAVDVFGRKRTVVLGALLGSIPCFILPFIKNTANEYFEISLAIFAKLMVTGSYNCMYIFTPESFPTVLRSTTVNYCLGAQNVAVTIAAIFSELSFGPNKSGPFITYGLVGLVGSLLLGVFGKETLGIPLFNTVEEYKKFATS